MTARQKVAALSFAIDAVCNMHGSRTGEEGHTGDATRCKCEYAAAIKGLRYMRKEYFGLIQQAKKKVVKR